MIPRMDIVYLAFPQWSSSYYPLVDWKWSRLCLFSRLGENLDRSSFHIHASFFSCFEKGLPPFLCSCFLGGLEELGIFNILSPPLAAILSSMS